MNAVVLSLVLGSAVAGQAQTWPTAETMLYIRTTPSGAEIMLDGKPLGTSDGLFPVKAGEYKIVLDLEGHQPHEETVTVRDGRITRIVLELKAHPEPDEAVADRAAEDLVDGTLEIRWRPVERKVSDFPDSGDVSTPEAALATYHRAIARNDYEALVRLSRVRLSYPAVDRLYPADLERYWVKADDNDSETVAAYNKAILDGEIVGVMEYGDELAAVVSRPESPPGKGEFPFSRRFFCLVDGEWKNLGEDRCATQESAVATFPDRAAMLRQYAFTPDAELLEPAEAACRKLIARFVEAARAGDRGTVAECLSPNVQVDSTLDDTREVIAAGLDPADIRLVNVRDDDAIVVTEFAEIGDRKYPNRMCVLYTLVRPNGKWLIWDIDLEDVEGLASEIRRFDAEHGSGEAAARPAQRLQPPDAETRHTAKLDFRIAPTKEALGLDEMNRYASELDDHGPFAGRGKAEFGWYAIDEKPRQELVPSEYQDQMYLLLSNRPDEVMLSGDVERPWEIHEVIVSDAAARPSIQLTLDEAGARRMAKLSEAHLNRHLAVVIDDRVVSCPVVQSRLHKSIQITGDFTLAEARQMADLFRSGSVAPPTESPAAEGPPSDSTAKINAVQAQLRRLRSALDIYELDNGDCPTTAQGLESLIRQPDDASESDQWQGPYIDSKSAPVDPWGNSLQYEHGEDDSRPRIWSVGPDGVNGTKDDVTSG